MSRSARVIGAGFAAVLAIALSLALAAPGLTVRYARPSDASLLPGGNGKRPEPPMEAFAAAEHQSVRTGIIDPLQAQDAMLAARAQGAAIKTAAGALGRGWKELGPKPYVSDDDTYNDVYGGTNNLGWGVISGRVTALALDPNDRSENTVWVGTAGGGVWVTRNGGVNWKTVWDDKPVLAIGAIAFDAKRPKTMYVGTGEGNLGGGTMFRGIGVYRSTDAGKTFTRVTKNVKANVISSIAAHNGIVYVGTDLGLWRSTDGGNSYADAKIPTNEAGTAPHKGLFGTVVTDVQLHPDRPSQVTVAVGWPRGKLWTPGNGLYRSTRSGAPGSWTRMNIDGLKAGSVSNDPIGRMSLSYARGAGQNHDVLWALVQDPGQLNNRLMNDVAKPPAGMATVLNGVYRSADDGATWTLKGTSQTFSAAPGSGIAALTPLYSPGIQAWYNNWIRVSPAAGEERVFVGMEEIYQTTANPAGPGPAAWTTIGRYWNSCTSFLNVGCDDVPVGPYAGGTTHPDQHAAAFSADGKRFYAGNDGGVFVQDSPNGSFSNEGWRSVNDGLGTTQPYYAVMGSDGAAFAGFQDNGVAKITPEGYGVAIFGGDGGDMAVEPNNSDHIWEEYVGGVTSVTKDGGKSWTNNAPELTAAAFIAPFEMDPTNANHVVLGGREIVETTKGVETICPHDYVGSGTYPPERAGCDWMYSFDLGQNTTVTPPVNYTASAVDVQGTAVYVGYCGTCGLLSGDKTSDTKVKTGIATNRKPGCKAATGTSACWHHAAGKGLPNRYITDVAIDPRNPSVIYVTLAGYSRRWLPPTSKTRNVGRGHVFVSRNAGASFTDISKNLPDEPAESVEIKGDRLFVGTHSGVYTTAKSGAAFERLGRALPASPAMDVNLNPQGTKLVVATHGRGVWSYDLGAAGGMHKGHSNATGFRPTQSGYSVVGVPSARTTGTQSTSVSPVAQRRNPAAPPAAPAAAAAATALSVAFALRRRRRIVSKFRG